MALDPVAQRYAQTLYVDRTEELARKNATEIAELRASLAVRGQSANTTGNYYSEMARLGIQHVAEAADARCDTLLEAYEHARIPIDDQAVKDIYHAVEQVCEGHQTGLVANLRHQIGRSHMPPQLSDQIAEVIARETSSTKARINRKLSATRDEQILAARAMTGAPAGTAERGGQSSNPLVRLWHASAKWQWFAGLFCAAFIMVGVQEFFFGVVILLLSTLSVISKLGHSNWKLIVKCIGAAGLTIVFAILVYIIWAVKGVGAWSHIHLPSTESSHTAKSAQTRSDQTIGAADKYLSGGLPKGATPLTGVPSASPTDAPSLDAARKNRTKPSNGTKSAANETPSARQNSDNALPRPPAAPTVQLNNAPNGIAIGGGTVTNPTVNNYSVPERHLSQIQRTEIESLAASLPESTTDFLTVEAENDPESSTYGDEIRAAFAAHGRAGGNQITLRLVETPPVPKGVYVLISGENDPNFGLAQKIANGLARAGVSVLFERGTDLREGQVKIVVGYRP